MNMYLKRVPFGNVAIGQRFLQCEYLYIFNNTEEGGLNEDPNNPEYDYLYETKMEEETIVIPEDGFGSFEESRITNSTCGYIHPSNYVYILENINTK